MLVRGGKSKTELVGRIKSEINEDVLNKYWKGYKMVPFALYDDKKIYMANHNSPPADFNKVENIYIGLWRQEFIANTMINFEGEEMGILNLDSLSPTSSYPTIYSLTVHEMFHAYQEKIGFFDKITTKYNEFMFMKYPFTKENIELRVIERQELLKAAFSQNNSQRKKHIGRFMGAREKRAALIGDLINYELGLESIEGTATYVEYKAYIDKTNLPEKFVLSKYGNNLGGHPENFDSFRQSCYNPGMFICLILDQYNLDWQEEFMSSGKLLYDFFLEKISVPKENIEIKDLDLSLAEYLADSETTRRKNSVDKFLNSEGYKIVIDETMRCAGFNPMQVVPYENQVLHQTFLGVQFNSQKIFLKGQSLSKQSQNPWEFEQVIFFSDEKPIINDGVIKIQDIGELKGSVKIIDNTYYISMN